MLLQARNADDYYVLFNGFLITLLNRLPWLRSNLLIMVSALNVFPLSLPGLGAASVKLYSSLNTFCGIWYHRTIFLELSSRPVMFLSPLLMGRIVNRYTHPSLFRFIYFTSPMGEYLCILNPGHWLQLVLLSYLISVAARFPLRKIMDRRLWTRFSRAKKLLLAR